MKTFRGFDRLRNLRPGRGDGVRRRSRVFSMMQLIECMEPRVLLTAAHSAADISDTLLLNGLNKSGSLVFDGVSAVTAGSWVNQSGSPTLVVAGTGSVYSVTSGGAVNITLNTQTSGGTTASLVLAGNINATNDVVALNETSGGIPVSGGFDLLLNASGSYAQSNFAGTWNVSAADFRGSFTINSSGSITSGLIYLENGQKSFGVTGGTAVLNSDGTGTLTFATSSTGSIASVSLNVAMDASKDVVVGNASTLGNGSTSGELAVLVKNSSAGTADLVGVTWTLNSAQGDGSFTFRPDHNLSGSLTDSNGTTWTISGNYTVGGNGSIMLNLSEKSPGHSRRESLFGTINRSKNLIALDRAIANGASGTSLTVLTRSANHAPTEAKSATLSQTAFGQVAVAVDYSTLLSATKAHDADHDTLSFIVTSVPGGSGTLSITHNGSTSAVVVGVTTVVDGDTLTWVPSLTGHGELNAFSVTAFDGTVRAANPTKIFVATSALPVVSITPKKGSALEAKVGMPGANGGFQIQRSGGDLTQPLTVSLHFAGSAVDGVNYTLLGPGNASLSTDATVTFAANQKTLTLTVVPIDDHTADGTLTVKAMVQPDPNSTSPSYTPFHATAQVNILDGAPTVTITTAPGVKSVREGASNQLAFFVERLPSQGGNVNDTLTVGLNYTASTFNVALLTAPTSVTFNPGEVKKRIVISTTDDGIADPTQKIVAMITGTSFNSSRGQSSASVDVIDGSPTVKVKTDISTALESNATGSFGEFTVMRSGSTANAITVNFTTATGNHFAVLGTNYTLQDQNGTPLTNSLTIPAGTDHLDVKVIPIDDGMNDPKLKASIKLMPDATPTYHVGSPGTSVVTIINNDRFPTIANGTVNVSTAKDTALQLPFAALVTDTGAALAAGETNGTLQLVVGQVLAGKLKILRAGAATQVSAGAKTVVNVGDTLFWTPPKGVTGTNLPAFTLFAKDGTLQSLTASVFDVTIA